MKAKEQIEKLAKDKGWDDLKKKRMLALVPNLTMVSSMSAENEHALMYADEKLGVTLEIITPKKNGSFGKGESYFFINNDKREFKTPLELMEALYDKKFKPKEEHNEQ